MTETTHGSRAVDESKQPLADLIADLEGLAAVWHRAATVPDPRYGPHDAGYDEALKVCARQLRRALAGALDGCRG